MWNVIIAEDAIIAVMIPYSIKVSFTSTSHNSKTASQPLQVRLLNVHQCTD